jgi:hypothetical protein
MSLQREDSGLICNAAFILVIFLSVCVCVKQTNHKSLRTARRISQREREIHRKRERFTGREIHRERERFTEREREIHGERDSQREREIHGERERDSRGERFTERERFTGREGERETARQHIQSNPQTTVWSGFSSLANALLTNDLRGL